MKLNEMGIEIKIIRKKIKNIYLRVACLTGQVRVSAPQALSLRHIQAFIKSKLNWIKKQQRKRLSRPQQADPLHRDDTTHYFKGRPYLLKIIEHAGRPTVSLLDSQLRLFVQAHTPEFQRKIILETWYKEQLKEQINQLIQTWEKKMQVAVTTLTIRKMKTRWGSCSPQRGSIRINLELVKRPLEQLEYVVVHELVHLLEPSHNQRFIALMNQFLPDWRLRRAQLNQGLLRSPHHNT